MNRSRMLLRQIGLHQRSFWRNPESAFFSFAMPLAVLVAYGATVSNTVVPGHDGARILTLFVPGILAFGVVVVAYGNLAATIAAQRADGVLKRLRSTPLDPSLYIAGQLVSVLAITVLISVATIGLGAAAFGATPRAAAMPQLVIVLAVGIACFAALGLAISAAIPTADSANPITNGTYLPLAMISGMFSATLHMPASISAVVGLFPLKALTDGLRAAYDPSAQGLALADLAVLAAWAVAGLLLAGRFFKWEP
jgi:ABC-2 type transport system permease protein